MLKVIGLYKNYGRKKALNNLNIDFPEHGIVGLLGDNGSGKTTLLRILAGFRKPTKGFVFNQRLLINDVQLNISLNADLNEVYHYKINEIVLLYQSLFKDFNLKQCQKICQEGNLNEESLIINLSKGEKTYLILALTLSRDVPIYLLDEPFSGLEILGRKRMMDCIIKYVDTQKKLMIISTHDLSHLERIIDQVVLLKNGELIANELITDIDGDLREWYKNKHKQGLNYE